MPPAVRAAIPKLRRSCNPYVQLEHAGMFSAIPPPSVLARTGVTIRPSGDREVETSGQALLRTLSETTRTVSAPAGTKEQYHYDEKDQTFNGYQAGRS